MEKPTTLRFGELEAVLADINSIASVHRTSFQARIKDIQRQGLLSMQDMPRGKAASYGLYELMLMAIAVEMCQLGLSTKRAVQVILEDEYPVWMSARMAANYIEARPEVFNPGPGDCGNPPDQKMWGFSPNWRNAEDTDPFSMFLYFDPAVLSPWIEPEGGEEGGDIASATFFYAGRGIVAESIARWTTGPTRRLGLINVTKLLFDIAANLAGTGGLAIIKEFAAVAEGWLHRGDFDLDEWLVNVTKTKGMMVAGRPLGGGAQWRPLEALLEVEADKFARYVKPIQQRIDESDSLGLSDRTYADAVIRLPGQRELVVDAKVPPYADIPQEGIHRRLDELAEEPYRHKFSDKTRFVVLYVPSDDYLAGAMSIDRGLMERAFRQNVVIATPSTFLNLLSEVEAAWEKYREEFPDLWEDEFETLTADPRKGETDGDR